MGTNTFNSATDGDIIPASDVNQFVTALIDSIVPRDASKSPTDLGGQLGSSLYRFTRAYIRDYFIGTASNNLKIYEGATDEIWIERGGTSSETIKIKDGTIELWDNGSVFLSVDENGVNTEQFFDFDSLKTKQAKIEVDNFLDSTGDASSFKEVSAVTINNCLQGKYLLMDFSADTTVDGTTGGSNFRLYVNGSTEVSWLNMTRQGTGEETSVKRVYKYQIPSDGNYTFSMRVQHFSYAIGAMIVQEV